MKTLTDETLIFAENQQLLTNRLILRPVDLSDAQAMFDYASSEETVADVFPAHKTIEDTKSAIATYFMAAPLGKYGIALKETNRLIGTIDLRVNHAHATGELGYVLNRNFWGQGYMPEAVNELLRLGFEKLKLIRIFAVHDIDNPKSGRVMEKNGMKQEGVIHNARIAKDKIVTDILRGMTIEEWQLAHPESKSRMDGKIC